MPGKTVKELETAYGELQERLLRGELSETEFRAKVQQLGFEDDQGHQWQVGQYTGQWYRYDQGWWSSDTPPEPGAAQASPATPAAQEAKGQYWRPITPWLVAPLVILLLVASVLLVAGLNSPEWGGSSVPIAEVSATPGASPTRPLASPTQETTPAPPSPTLPPPTATREPVMTRWTPTSVQAGAAISTQTAASPTPTSPDAATETPASTDTPVPTDTPVLATATPTLVPRPTASPTASRTRPAPQATPPQPQQTSFSGRIFFPVYDPQAARRTFDIYAVRLASGRREPVAGQASQPAISPDGRRLAYRSWETGQQGLSVLELEDGQTWRWVDSAEAVRPSWSPDSQNIVFPSQQASDRRWRIYRTTGLEYGELQRYGSDILGRAPAWLSDGRIVYWDCPLANCGLYVMEGNGSNPIRLTTAEHDTAPAASPDGQQIAFMSNRGSNWDIYVIESRAPSGTAPRRLTEHAARDGLPTWSPNGQWLAFVSDRGGTWAVWAMRPDGSQLQRLFEMGGTLEGQVVYAQGGEQTDWTSETIAWGP